MVSTWRGSCKAVYLKPLEVLSSVKPCVGFCLRGFDLELVTASVQPGFNIGVLFVGRRWWPLRNPSHGFCLQRHDTALGQSSADQICVDDDTSQGRDRILPASSGRTGARSIAL